MARLLATYVDRTGRRAFEGAFLEATRFVGGVARVTSARDGRVGLVDREGKLVLEHRFDVIHPFVKGLARACVGGKWGFVAPSGRVVVEPTYDGAFEVDDGRMTVTLGGKQGFLDENGAVIVAPRYAFASWHHDGLAVVALEDGSGDGYVDRDGKLVIAGPFQEGTAFSSGLARVKRAGLWGVIDREGRLVHEPIYERLGEIRDGACWAVKAGKCGVLTAAGKLLGDAWVDEIRQVEELGIWPIRRGADWGFLLPDGRVVATGATSTLGFLGGLGRIRRDDKWGFVDKDGELVVPCRYLDAWGFEDERAAVKLENGWTFIDPTGRELGSGGYAVATWARDKMALVRVGEKWGYLDHDGNVAIEATYDWADHFGDGLGAVLAVDRTNVAVPAERDGVHVLPAGGLSHRIFDTAARQAHVIAILGFGRELAGAELEALRKRVEAWERTLRPEGKLYTEDKWLSGTSLYLRVQGLADPRADLSLLVDELIDAGTPIVEMLFARWGQPPTERVMQPNADPAMFATAYRANFANFPEYWASVWSTDGPAPAPENYFYLKGAITMGNSLCLEERHAPVWFPDVRICMGALQNQGESYLPKNDASARVDQKLRAALPERFARTWVKPGLARRTPEPQVRDASAGVEPIAYDGRTGYAFAFECSDLLHVFSAARMRYREPELMEALRTVVLDPELKLAPVILWQRFGRQLPGTPLSEPTVLVVNLFERV